MTCEANKQGKVTEITASNEIRETRSLASKRMKMTLSKAETLNHRIFIDFVQRPLQWCVAP